MFNFGENWLAFSKNAINQQSLDKAKQSIGQLLDSVSLQGVTWLDLGCGSGLFSIAAWHMGAIVTGADINPLCLQVTQENAQRFLPPQQVADIQLVQLSALDKQMLANQGLFDIVYSWGVLHHTGNMWQAIENVTTLVKPGGKLVISIYNKHVTSPIWAVIKHLYVKSPRFVKRLMAYSFGAIIYLAKFVVTGRNPLVQARGMDFWYDVIDWIGGYPYQYATVDEIVTFVEKYNFKLLHVLPAQVPTGCNEFVFSKESA